MPTSSAIPARRKKYPLIPSGFLEIRPIADSSNWYINHSGTADMGRVDATDPEQRTRAECASRRQALQMVQALRESDNPAVREIEWAASGPQVGVRETRRVKGLYVITEDDARTGGAFEDAIAWRSGLLDPGGQSGTEVARMKIHDVPYRAIMPEKMDGLLMAGRCISATHLGAAAGKSMGNCMATGHAAGVAAAMSAGKGILAARVEGIRTSGQAPRRRRELRRGRPGTEDPVRYGYDNSVRTHPAGSSNRVRGGAGGTAALLPSRQRHRAVLWR